MTVTEFRQSFPQFSAEFFPDARVEFYFALAGKRLPAERWGDLLHEGVALFTAHFLTLERAASLKADGTGGFDAAAGPAVGVSKTVGGVSKTENRAGSAASGYLNAGQWNNTIYGQQFWELAQLVGVGGTVV
jgi:hypothetical protein